MDPPVKRSGWQPPQDSGLWKAADRVSQEVWGVLRQGQRERLKARFASAKPRLALGSARIVWQPRRNLNHPLRQKSKLLHGILTQEQICRRAHLWRRP